MYTCHRVVLTSEIHLRSPSAKSTHNVNAVTLTVAAHVHTYCSQRQLAVHRAPVPVTSRLERVMELCLSSHVQHTRQCAAILSAQCALPVHIITAILVIWLEASTSPTKSELTRAWFQLLDRAAILV